MLHQIESVDICFHASFHKAASAESNSLRLKSLNVDIQNTSIKWVGDETRIVEGPIHRNAIGVFLRFMWVFIAYRERTAMPWYGIKQELFALMGDNLHKLNQPRKNQGNPAIRQLFGESTRTDEKKKKDVACCRLVHFFQIPFGPDAFQPVIDGEILRPSHIHVRLRNANCAEIFPAEPDELAAILRDFDPVTGMVISPLDRHDLPKSVRNYEDTLPDDDTEQDDDPGAKPHSDDQADDSTSDAEDRLERSDGGKSSQQPFKPVDPAGGVSTVADPEIDEHAPEFVYQNIVEEIERTLDSSQLLAKFLDDSTRGLVEPQGKAWRLSPAVKNRDFELGSVLSGMVKRLKYFVGISQEWTELGEVAGGLVVLGINRE